MVILEWLYNYIPTAATSTYRHWKEKGLTKHGRCWRTASDHCTSPSRYALSENWTLSRLKRTKRELSKMTAKISWVNFAIYINYLSTSKKYHPCMYRVEAGRYLLLPSLHIFFCCIIRRRNDAECLAYVIGVKKSKTAKASLLFSCQGSYTYIFSDPNTHQFLVPSVSATSTLLPLTTQDIGTNQIEQAPTVPSYTKWLSLIVFKTNNGVVGLVQFRQGLEHCGAIACACTRGQRAERQT